MKRNRIVLSVAGLACVGLVGAALAGPLRGHPHLQKARNMINKALEACKAAKADERHGEFGGHRDKAEELLSQAKGELDAAAEYANSHP